jgi:hypothetical protein
LHVQALTTSVAFWYGLETFKLRGQMVEEVRAGAAAAAAASSTESQLQVSCEMWSQQAAG